MASASNTPPQYSYYPDPNPNLYPNPNYIRPPPFSPSAPPPSPPTIRHVISNPSEFKSYINNLGFEGFIQGDKRNEQFALSDAQYEFVGKIPDIIKYFTFQQKGVPEPKTGPMISHRYPEMKPKYTITPYTEELLGTPASESKFRFRFVLHNATIPINRHIIFLINKLYDHDGALDPRQKGGSKSKTKKRSKCTVQIAK